MESRYLIVNSNTKDSNGKSIFIPLRGNRKFKASQFLIDSLKEDGQVYPVICFEKNPGYYLIVDGQHRLDGLQKLNFPVELKIYKKSDELENESEFIDKLIRSSNSTSKNWSNIDHLNWHSNFNSNPVYKRFRELKNSYKYLDINFLYSALRKESVIKSIVAKHIKERKLEFDMMVDEKMLIDINYITQKVTEYFKGDKNYYIKKQNLNFALYLYYREFPNNFNKEEIKDLFCNNKYEVYALNHYSIIYQFIQRMLND